MTMAEEQKKPSDDIKVTDRRSFTASGERRLPDQPKSETSRPRVAAPPADAAEGNEPGDAGSLDFEGFARYLAQVALHQLAGARNPATGETVASLEEARQTIEILKMLQEKTRGNLTSRESRSLEEMLYHLKLEYSRRAAAARR